MTTLTPIETIQDLEEIRFEMERLAERDPEPYTPESRRLALLAKQIREYELRRFVPLGLDSEEG